MSDVKDSTFFPIWVHLKNLDTELYLYKLLY